MWDFLSCSENFGVKNAELSFCNVCSKVNYAQPQAAYTPLNSLLGLEQLRFSLIFSNTCLLCGFFSYSFRFLWNMEIPFSERLFLLFVHRAPKVKIHVFCYFSWLASAGLIHGNVVCKLWLQFQRYQRLRCLSSLQPNASRYLPENPHCFPATELVLLCGKMRKPQQYIFSVFIIFTFWYPVVNVCASFEAEGLIARRIKKYTNIFKGSEKCIINTLSSCQCKCVFMPSWQRCKVT